MTRRLKSLRRWPWLCIALALVFAGAGCGKKDAPKPSKFFGKLYSYQNPQEARKALRIKDQSWQEVQRSQLLPTDPRPPFNILKVMLKDHYQSGVRGDLVLEFFNDRLMEARFYPSDVDIYRSALEGDGISFSAQLEARIDPRTRVWMGKEQSSRWYVGWVDVALLAEHDSWIRNHS
jgi:hypothetical protein